MLVGMMLALTGLLSLLVVWIVQGASQRAAPLGEAAEYLIGLLAGVGVAALDYYVMFPAFFRQPPPGWMVLGGSALEGVVFAWLVVWALRQLARRPAGAGDS